jgi:hypothetical protein
MNPAIADRAFELARSVTPLGLGAALIEVDTGQENATERAVAAARAALPAEMPGTATPSRRQQGP